MPDTIFMGMCSQNERKKYYFDLVGKLRERIKFDSKKICLKSTRGMIMFPKYNFDRQPEINMQKCK